jgi:superfamily II DNA helicase RecQ
VLALTATATARVEHDIAVQLGLPSCLVFRSSFNRPNLRYEVRPKPPKAKALVALVELIKERYTERVGGRLQVKCGIIYAFSRAECERLAAELDDELRRQLHIRARLVTCAAAPPRRRARSRCRRPGPGPGLGLGRQRLFCCLPPASPYLSACLLASR